MLRAADKEQEMLQLVVAVRKELSNFNCLLAIYASMPQSYRLRFHIVD
jgi:hypothetical protein